MKVGDRVAVNLRWLRGFGSDALQMWMPMRGTIVAKRDSLVVDWDGRPYHCRSWDECNLVHEDRVHLETL